MLNAGLLETIVVKDWMAKMWAQILPKINVRTDIIVRSDDRIGWAIRKGSSKLDEEIRDFFKNYAAYKLSNEAQTAQRKAREHLLQSESRPL